MNLLHPGDQVIIRPDIGDLDDCASGFVDDMINFAGQVMTISEVYTIDDHPWSAYGHYGYRLVEDPVEIVWSDDLFVDVVSDTEEDEECSLDGLI